MIRSRYFPAGPIRSKWPEHIVVHGPSSPPRGKFGVDAIGPNVAEAWLARFITSLPRPRSSGLDKTPKL